MYYVLYFVAGAFTANGVPHFLNGINGREYQTPFGRSSSAVTNVLWGSLNFLIAWVLWHYAGLHRSLAHTVRYEFVFAAGALLVSLGLASLYSSPKPKPAK